MTKKEWTCFGKGQRVTMQRDGKDYFGTVIRINTNWSQVLVRWDETLTEIWYGRLGLELVKNGTDGR